MFLTSAIRGVQRAFLDGTEPGDTPAVAVDAAGTAYIAWNEKIRRVRGSRKNLSIRACNRPKPPMPSSFSRFRLSRSTGVSRLRSMKWWRSSSQSLRA